MHIGLLQKKRINYPEHHGGCRRAVIILLVTALCRVAAMASCLTAPSGLVGFWPGDGNGKDLVGTNHGTLLNGTTFAPGEVGSAFSFDGTNDTVQIGGAPIPAPWTAEFWVNRQASPQDSAVLLGDTNTALKLEQYQNTKQVGFTKWGVTDYYFNYTAPTGTWVHLVFVATTTNLKLYVNGAIRDTNNASMPLPRGQLGNDISGRFNKPLKGLVDEVSLYTRALSAGEIASLYTAGAEGKCKAPQITVPPQDQIVSPGVTASFSVTATGLDPLKYQWRTNGIPIAGATTNSYMTPPLQVGNSGVGYTVVVTNTAGSITSSVVTVTVCSPGLPDNFECRQTLTGTNLSFQFSNSGATSQTNEPHHFPDLDYSFFAFPPDSSVWFTWTAPFAGGVVVQVTNAFVVPGVAVYTGVNLTNLARVAYNGNSPGNQPPPAARAIFTAVAGQTYQIAVDSFGFATFTFTLNLSPPPPNDLFSNATPISGAYYGLAGSFIGASREPSEPGHGDSSLGQTLWWNWTAPTNGPNPLSVRLMADAVSFPPGVRVYTGNTVPSLASVTLTTKTNGMTTDAIFNAVPGTTYRLALAGIQNDPKSIAQVIGNFRFRLNLRALALSITNFTSSTNGNGSVPFQADARVQNLGATISGPLRVSVSSISGLSTVKPISSMVSTITNLSITNLPSPLAPGQSMLAHISGTAPAPALDGGFDQAKIHAFGVYAELQEQPITNRWFTVDETLVTYDEWPAIGDVIGPGGGVIRLDPDYLGLSAFNPLSSVAVLGTSTVTEGRATNYTGRAAYTDATVHNFTNTTWSASRFSITTNGLFSAGSVTSNTVVLLNAPYSYGGLLYTATTNVTVLNLPPPTLTSAKFLTNKSFAFTVSGVPNRSHVLEASTNLSSATNWISLATNTTGLNGLLNFTNFPLTNFPRRFYRAREL